MMTIEILEDGTIRVETGDLAGPLHLKIEEFLELISKRSGGEVTVVKKLKESHSHQHSHKKVKV